MVPVLLLALCLPPDVALALGLVGPARMATAGRRDTPAHPSTDQSPARGERVGAQAPGFHRIALAAAVPKSALPDTAAIALIRRSIAREGRRIVASLKAVERDTAARDLPAAIRERQRRQRIHIARRIKDLRARFASAAKASGHDRAVKLEAALAMLRDAHQRPGADSRVPPELPFRSVTGVAHVEESGHSNGTLALPAARFAGSNAIVPPPQSNALVADPSELGDSVDVVLSDETRAVATSLEGKPAAILDWMRRRVRFIPTWGSTQGSEGCRATLECNATDAASLLIALLRASGIPARYVVGRVELTPDAFRNVVGGFRDVAAAARFATAGGVAAALVVSSGVPVAVRMNHVWVEALVDYVPGRGDGGQPDTWVPLDPVLKPIAVLTAIDATATSGIDPLAIENAMLATATIANGGDSVTGMSLDEAETALSAARETLKAHIDGLPASSESIDLLGGVVSSASPLPVLPGSLPARVVSVQDRPATLPTSLRQTVTIQIVDPFEIDPSLSHSESAPALAGSRISLGYLPASEADAMTIESYGGILHTPPSAAQLRPVLYRDGAAVATGAPVGLGVSQRLRVTLSEPSGSEVIEHPVVAGAYAVLALDWSHLAAESVDADRTALTDAIVDARLGAGAPEVLLRRTLALHADAYLAQVGATSRAIGEQLDVVTASRTTELLVSFGPTYATTFGVPTGLLGTGTTIDVQRRAFAVGNRDGNREAEKRYTRISSELASAAEHGTLQAIQHAEAVSAVRLLGIANEQGIPIFRIDQANAGQLIPQLTVDSQLRSKVQALVASGLEVVISRDELDIGSWSGIGYVATDPNTGSGAYTISGGLNGGTTILPSPFGELCEFLLNAIQAAAAFIDDALLEVLSEVADVLGAWLAYLEVYDETDCVPDASTTATLSLLMSAMLVGFGVTFAIAPLTIVYALLFQNLLVTILSTAVIANEECGVQIP